jgi:hypothetical protein
MQLTNVVKTSEYGDSVVTILESGWHARATTEGSSAGGDTAHLSDSQVHVLRRLEEAKWRNKAKHTNQI